jgi:hypothetical protein
VQVSDRWHLWHGLGGAVEKTVIAHNSCWRAGSCGSTRPIDERTRARHAAVHALLGQGVGLLECARRLGWALNTVKRYARAATAEHLARPARYGRTLVDPYRDHLRRRLATEPDVAVTQLLAEIRELGYTGSANLLMRYLNQGRAATERAVPAPRRLVSWIMTRPADLPEPDRAHLDQLLGACPHLIILAKHVRAFASLLTDRRGAELEGWMCAVEASDLPALHGFVPRPAQGPSRRRRRAEPALQQRPRRRRQHQGQTAQTADVRPSWLRPTSTADPSQLTNTTSSVPEPTI